MSLVEKTLKKMRGAAERAAPAGAGAARTPARRADPALVVSFDQNALRAMHMLPAME